MPDPLIPLLPYQREAVLCPARFTWNCWARQTGKSFTFSLRRLLRGLFRRRNQIILSAGERQSREVMEKVRMHCAALKVWADLHGPADFNDAAGGRLELRLPNGARIIALPANPHTARGFTGDVFLDEFAMHRDDAAIWAALFPTLMRGEGELDVASTPWGCRNAFYRLRENPQFTHRTLTLEEAVAQGLAADPAALRVAMDDETAWRQEFCCEFFDETTALLPYELIRRCQDPSLTVVPEWSTLERRDRDVYVGVDVGRLRDLTAIWLWERDADTAKRPIAGMPRRLDADPRGGRSEATGIEARHGGNVCGPNSPQACGVDLQGAPIAEQNGGQVSSEEGQCGAAVASGPDAAVFVTRGVVTLANAPFDEQEGLLARLLSMPAMRRCCIDATGLGMHLAERLARRFGEHRVESATFTAGRKAELAGMLRVLAERGRLRIPADESIARDWHSIARTALAGGQVRYESDRAGSGHGDRFWAAALGLHGASAEVGRPEVLTGGAIMFARKGVW